VKTKEKSIEKDPTHENTSKNEQEVAFPFVSPCDCVTPHARTYVIYALGSGFKRDIKLDVS